MRYRYSFLIFFIALILQSTVMNHFRVFNMSPNLILCMVVIFAFLYEGNHGIIWGILFGLAADVCFAEIIGIAALCNFAVALISMEMKRFLYKDSIISLMIVSLAGTTVYALLYWSVNAMLSNSADFLYVMEKEAVLVIYHIIITLIIYKIVSRSVIKHRGDRYMYRGNPQVTRSINRL